MKTTQTHIRLQLLAIVLVKSNEYQSIEKKKKKLPLTT